MVGSSSGRAATEAEVTFDDMTVLSEGGVDLFVLTWNAPDFWITPCVFDALSAQIRIRGGSRLTEANAETVMP